MNSHSKADIVLAYRHLYRAGLHAVQYSKPARFVLKRIIDEAFRKGKPGDFNPRRIGNTVVFLENAAKDRGIEHAVVKNILRVRWWQHQTDMRKLRYDRFVKL